MKTKFTLEEGEKLNRSPNEPVLLIVGAIGRAKSPYLWIGNDAEDDMACFATLSGRKTLERLASGILQALNQTEE